MRKSNLGGYQTLTTVASILGGPIHLVAGLISLGMVLASLLFGLVKYVFSFIF